MAEGQENIKQQINTAQAGLSLDQSINQVPKGKLTYALNAAIENFDANSVSYQNEPGNELCINFPEGFIVIGRHNIIEQQRCVFFLVNPDTGDNEIGYMNLNNCEYTKFISGACLSFSINHPILKTVHKITNCSTEIYFTDGVNPRRFINLDEAPLKIKPGTEVCDRQFIDEIDCNKIKVQPVFNIPTLEIVDVINGGNLISGTYQFAIQYCDVAGDPYTSYYSVTNPTPIADPKITTLEFNYPVGRTIVLDVSGIDVTGYFKYFNIAVIKTVNNIPSVELVGTYTIESDARQIFYSGQNQTQIRLTINDIFEKFPYYEIAQDLTAVQDILVWDQLTSIDRVNYQKIANQITLEWESWRIPKNENYADELNATNFRGYLRDEVYPFEIVFLLDNGKETDGFHIPGRAVLPFDLSEISPSNPDFIGEPDPTTGASPRWKIYNTAIVKGTYPMYGSSDSYKGPYQWGEFSYWESVETYPCDEEVWGELSSQPIRHHKFPDIGVSPIFENPELSFTVIKDESNVTEIVTVEPDSEKTFWEKLIEKLLEVTDVITNEEDLPKEDIIQLNLQGDKNAIFPIGVKIDTRQIQSLIITSDLTTAQKESIVGFKIVRGDRGTNKSIVGKGILRNVGKYTRQDTDYYFPNYPYNDLTEDPFLLSGNNGFAEECNTYEVIGLEDGTFTYTECITNSEKTEPILSGEVLETCSLTPPTVSFAVPQGANPVSIKEYDTYELRVNKPNLVQKRRYAAFTYTDIFFNEKTITLGGGNLSKSSKFKATIKVARGTPVVKIDAGKHDTDEYSITLKSSSTGTAGVCYPERLNAFDSEESKYRHVFNSPETSFGQPFLGDILKLENVIFGGGKGHFVEVKKNALYKLLSKEAQEDALLSSEKIASITSPFSATALFTAYQAYTQIYLNGITRKNYGWSYNSIANYNYYTPIENEEGIKQRELDIVQYLIPGVQNVNDKHNINNYQRESSVYLKTRDNDPLSYPNEVPSIVDTGYGDLIKDRSRYINSDWDCSMPEREFPLTTVSYYASLKNQFLNQWGQIYSYDTIDTGFQVIFSIATLGEAVVFGGDTFINRFSFKTKLPFFIDNRVGAPDDSDIFYDEIGNVAYPEYWHSARSILYNYLTEETPVTTLKNIISVKAKNFDCSNSQIPENNNPNRTYYNGKMYMFAYGVPTFYCESSINVDLRQAFNNREGDFYPHVSTNIPDDWVQESYVPIAQDNTYYYNVTYSKQNKENFFSHLPPNWREEICYTAFPFRAIYSDRQESVVDNRINNWLIYRPVSFYDFPQNYGSLVSLDGIQNRAILARFENKSLMYNKLLTINTSNPQAAYIGNDLLFKGAPPIDFAETDLGYVGSQNKMLLKIPQGQITVDAKRGQVFLISGESIADISDSATGLSRFFNDHLPFEILKHFPTVNTDNHYNGIGIHGVHDNKYDRVLITKLDYIPLSTEILYEESTERFYYIKTINEIEIRKYVDLLDPVYFCNKSWTLSYNLNTGSWISFHSYIPNFYIGNNNSFYSGLNSGCDIEAIVGEIVLATTTTTTTAEPFDCDLTGSAVEYACGFEAFAELVPSCTLTGIAEEIADCDFTVEVTPVLPTTTTTTTAGSTTTTTTVVFESATFGLSPSPSGLPSTACGDLADGGTTLYWTFGDPFAPGIILYTDPARTIPLTGYKYIAYSGDTSIYNINPVTGLVGSFTGVIC